MFESDRAAELLEVFAAEQLALERSGLPGSLAAPGIRVPTVSLLHVDGTQVASDDLFANGPTVVVFYRGSWCPYCNMALRAYERDLLPALRARGVQLVAVSPQTPDGSVASRDNNELSFTVASDPGNQLAAALGILTAPSTEALDAQISLGLDLREVNADGTVGLPMPTVAIIDTERVLRWIDVQPNYAKRTEPQQILDAVIQITQTPDAADSTPGLESVTSRMSELAQTLGVKSCLVMRSEPGSMVVAATAGVGASFYRVGDAGQKAATGDSETPLYCERVVDSGDEVFIRDSRNDEVFAGNADEVEFGLTNYFGLPVRNAAGEVVGTVCVLDDSGRDYDDRARGELEALRSDVEAILTHDPSALFG
ncbi:redoxin family protein [Mycolicibacterium sp. 120266]|uniref:redoxin domain-containing protein n=1 Tax=Mycolicibacterium sp. 120266 TaxID=3090601 RepID=UPI00299D1B85|nr:redoxin domain-containing protein [Mycolicibacterium sp. 120266]MDX1873561.1 redoxin family protein [Mycolicibacterium sp. 120266]